MSGKTQHNLTAGEWKAGSSARQRHDWSDHMTGWLYVDAENFIGQNVSRHLPYTKNDVICMAAAKKMLWALRSARAAVELIPERDLGYEPDRQAEPGTYLYPYKRELLDQIDKALPKFPDEEEEPEEKKMLHKIILEDEYFEAEKGPLPKLSLARSPSDPSMVEIDLMGDATITLTYKELEEALAYLQGKSVIR